LSKVGCDFIVEVVDRNNVELNPGKKYREKYRAQDGNF